MSPRIQQLAPPLKQRSLLEAPVGAEPVERVATPTARDARTDKVQCPIGGMSSIGCEFCAI
jgi:hypothetical protein